MGPSSEHSTMSAQSFDELVGMIFFRTAKCTISKTLANYKPRKCRLA